MRWMASSIFLVKVVLFDISMLHAFTYIFYNSLMI
jgi:hypothetical protein